MQRFMLITREETTAEQLGSDPKLSWSCSSSTMRGDRALVYIVGSGVRFEWRATSDAERHRYHRYRFYCNFKPIRSFKPPITIKQLRAAVSRSEWSPPHTDFRGHKSISMPTVIYDRIKSLRTARQPSELAKEIEFREKVRDSMALSSTERQKLLLSGPRLPKKLAVVTTMFVRNPHVVAAVLLRARGKCERCGTKAPFRRTSDGTPYLEVHHRIRLANGGEDTVENAVARCPNCHRREHFGQ
jgi:5-methylcytosine-specific restriction protein A